LGIEGLVEALIFPLNENVFLPDRAYFMGLLERENMMFNYKNRFYVSLVGVFSGRKEVLFLPVMDELYLTPFRLRACYLTMHRRANALLLSVGITADQFMCLLFLRQNGEMIQNALVDQMSSDPNTVSSLLTLLERKGYVEKVISSQDRRARLVSLTQLGRQVLDKASAILDEHYLLIKSAMTEEEASNLNRLLSRYESVNRRV